MADRPAAELKRRLGPDYELVQDLGEADLARLLALIEDARRRQRDALATAQEHALRFVPALLRKPLLKLFT
jgi:hypothetical protein